MKKLLLAIGLVATLVLSSCGGSSGTTETTEDGLVIEDLKVGKGEGAVSGDTIEVHYRGTLLDGTQFDSSYDRNESAIFPLGLNYLI